MSGYEIRCGNRNLQGLLVRVGGVNWSISIRDAIIKMMSGEMLLNIMVDGEMREVGIRGEGFDAYLVLEPEGYPLHQLTDLGSC
jgi:hypothetical protein